MTLTTFPGLGVILAAGSSTRMGQDKALLDWHGKSFLAAAIESLLPFTQQVLVVVGANRTALQSTVWAKGATLVTNPTPEAGQFSSLQAGLREVLNRGRDAAVITHVDRPPAAPTTLQALQVAFTFHSQAGKWAVVPQYGEKHGHPIVIGRDMIEAFLKAPASSNARQVEHENQERIVYLPVEDPNVICNVNTPEEYADLMNRNPVPDPS